MLLRKKKAHAFDSHTDWAANHPKHIRMPYNQQLSELALKLPPDEPIIILSNQGGIRWGYKTATVVINEMRYLMRLLPIEAAYFCPDDGRDSDRLFAAAAGVPYWDVRDRIQ